MELYHPLIAISKEDNEEYINIRVILKRTVIENTYYVYDLFKKSKKTETSMKGHNIVEIVNKIQRYISDLFRSVEEQNWRNNITDVWEDKSDKSDIRFSFEIDVYPNYNEVNSSENDQDYKNFVNKLFDFFTFLALVYASSEPEIMHKIRVKTPWLGFGIFGGSYSSMPHHQNPKNLTPKNRTSKNRTSKNRNPKNRKSKNRNPKNRNPKDRNPKNRNPKNRNPKDRKTKKKSYR